MSIRPPYSVPLPSNYPSNTSNGSSVHNMNHNPHVFPNTFRPRLFEENKPNCTLFPPNDFHKNEYTHPNPNVSYRFPHFVNSNPSQMSTASLPVRFPIPTNHYYPPHTVKHPAEPNNNMHALLNPYERNSGSTVNSYQTHFPSPIQHVNSSNLPGPFNFERYPNNACHFPVNDISKTFNAGPQNALPVCGDTNNIANYSENSIVSSSDSGNSSVMFSANSQALPSVLQNSGNLVSQQIQNNCIFSVPPPLFNSDATCIPLSNDQQTTSSKKEIELCTFLSKFSDSKEKKGKQITVPEFRSVLKAAFSLMKLLIESKCKLKNLMEADESKWNSELQNISNLQKQLSEICSLVSAPVHLNAVVKKLKLIKKKRELKKKTKVNQLSQRIKVEQNRKERHQEIDKYLDDIKEKNLKLKREAEMKKEADYILLEVRKKIHEAKRTIEKIKVFEKLRNARQANAVQKGLHILPDHNEKFEKKVARLKETMLKQLADYEAEEKALKVMLETEQEDQLEEEMQWKLKKIKTLQQIRKNNITECLFGNSEDPMPTDPLFLFHKYHTSANNSIENLAQIRHHWDVHIADDGESVPQKWIVPIVPSNSSWEQFLTTSIVSKQ